MEKQPTKKQIDILMKNGFSYEEVSAMSYEAISAKIGEILGNANSKPNFHKKAIENVPKANLDTSKLLLPPNLSVLIHRNERANSYEFGKAGNRLKVYFGSPEELKEEIDKYMDVLNNLPVEA